MTLAVDLRAELMKRRHDVMGIKHHYDRYGEVINQAIREMPRSLWRMDADVRVTTQDGVRRYSLAAIPGLISSDQVQGIFLESADSDDLEIGRFEIEDDYGALVLVLDQDPPAANRILTVYYLREWPTLDFSDPSAETDIDQEWLLSKAMSYLLLEADPEVENPNLIGSLLQMWDARRQVREKLIRRRPRPRKIRTRPLRTIGEAQGIVSEDDYLILE